MRLQSPMIPAGSTIWQPLGNRTFRALWLASIVANCGSWAYTVTAQWQITSMSTSPSMVSMILVAANLPQFLFLLPAGALCDMVDRRRILIVAQAALVLLPLLLGIAIYAHNAPIWLLLLVTFAIGIASSFSAPAWQVLVPEVVPREQLVSAVALNSVSINVSRSIGPAIGGAVITAFGAAAGCVVSAFAGLGACVVAYRLQAGKSDSDTSAQRVIDAMLGGLRFIRDAPRLRAILVREATFVFFASALWALLPALARLELGMGAAGYGLLVGCFGAGALGSAIAVPRLQRMFTGNQLAIPSTMLFSLACIVPILTDQEKITFAALFLGGAGWTAMLVIVNTGMQTQAPQWVRGRAVSAQAMMLSGILAAGGALWGYLAEHVGLQTTFLVAGFGLLVTLVLHCRYALTIGSSDASDDVSPANLEH